MTVLVTTTGELITSDPLTPKQLTQGGRPSLAKSSVPFGTFGDTSLLLLNGRPISYSQIYRTQPYVATAIGVLVRQISRLPLKAYERGSDGQRRRVHSHRLVDLIEQPAPGCSATQLKQWLALPACLHGNATLAKVRPSPGAPPERIWPLDWRYMQAYQADDIPSKPIRFWRYSELDDPIYLDPDEIIHLKWEPPDGQIGVSPLEQLGTTIRIEQAAQDYQESYLSDGVRSPGAIEFPQGVILDEQTRAEMRDDIRNSYGGAKNAAHPFLMPGGAKWVSMSHNAREAELINQRKLTREEVASVYAIPQPLMGILENATLANVEALHRMFYTTVLGPWLTLIEETFKAQVIDPEPAFEGMFVEFDLAEVLKGDKLKEIQALRLAVQSGLMTINEARSVQNLPRFDLDWCNEPLIPVNNLGTDPDADESNGESGDSVSQPDPR